MFIHEFIEHSPIHCSGEDVEVSAILEEGITLREHLERLLQRVDLSLAALDALLVAHAGVDTGRAQRLEGLERLVEQALRVLEVVERVDEVGARAVQVRLRLRLARLLRRDGRLGLLREGREGPQERGLN